MRALHVYPHEYHFRELSELTGKQLVRKVKRLPDEITPGMCATYLMGHGRIEQALGLVASGVQPHSLPMTLSINGSYRWNGPYPARAIHVLAGWDGKRDRLSASWEETLDAILQAPHLWGGWGSELSPLDMEPLTICLENTEARCDRSSQQSLHAMEDRLIALGADPKLVAARGMAAAAAVPGGHGDAIHPWQWDSLMRLLAWGVPPQDIAAGALARAIEADLGGVKSGYPVAQRTLGPRVQGLLDRGIPWVSPLQCKASESPVAMAVLTGCAVAIRAMHEAGLDLAWQDEKNDQTVLMIEPKAKKTTMRALDALPRETVERIISLKDRRGWTALHHAMRAGSGTYAGWLLDRGADPTVQDKKGKAPSDLFRLTGAKGAKEVTLIEEAMRRNGHGQAMTLHAAAAANALDAVERMLAEGAAPHEVEKGRNALGAALGGLNNRAVQAKTRQREVGRQALPLIRRLLEAGVDPNLPESGPWSHGRALHLACGHGLVEVAEALLEAGADPQALDSAGDTPMQGLRDTISVSLQRDRPGDVRKKDVDDYIAMAALFIQHGVDLEVQDASGKLPFAELRQVPAFADFIQMNAQRQRMEATIAAPSAKRVRPRM